ncbi:hypothetical protein JOM56_002978 [Amanita muscaria]
MGLFSFILSFQRNLSAAYVTSHIYCALRMSVLLSKASKFLASRLQIQLSSSFVDISYLGLLDERRKAKLIVIFQYFYAVRLFCGTH